MRRPFLPRSVEGRTVRMVFVVNPAAGRRRRLWDTEDLRARFHRIGIEVSVHVTRARGDACRIARELCSESDVVCAVGGDGTVNEVVNGILPRRIPLVVVPAGSGNDLADVVDCPRSPEDLVRVVEEGWGAEIDVIDFGDRFCVNSAGLGFEGSVNRLSHRLSRAGRSRYFLALAMALRSVHCPELAITTSRGDETRGRKLLVSIGNGRRTGGAFYLTPEAFPDDGLLDVCVVEPMSRSRMLRILPRALDGSHTRRPEVAMFRAESLRIEAAEPYPMHVDGEFVLAPPGRREVRVNPAALTVLCRPSARNRLSRKPIKVVSINGNWRSR